MSFFVNGIEYTDPDNLTLMRFLRDRLHLTSVKDGCSEGACGTCTVIIDSKATKACVTKTKLLEGKKILTVEGLSDWEKDVYTYAFGEAGAVQCGFCIPGMVLCTKALLDQNLNPTEAQIREALKNNICRCTGYAKIIKAVELAAKILREKKIPDTHKDWTIGQAVHRIDVRQKVTGTGIYPDDIYLPNMLEVVALRTAYPRAKILKIDTTEAKKVSGVVRIITAKDIPGSHKVGHIDRDWDAMIDEGEITHFLGDVLVLVVAETKAIAEQAKKLVKVEYEVLDPVRNPLEAMAEGAPLLHEGGNLLSHKHISQGDAQKAIENSDFVLTETFETPWTEHAFLEPECAISLPENDGVSIYSTDQGVYDTQRETAPFLNLPLEKVKVTNCLVGGGFGGKEDVTVQHLSALSALLTARPCKMKLTRAESLLFHPKRHPMSMTFVLGCNKEGIIQGVKAKVIADTGAYASLGGPVLERACTHAAGPYNYQNFEIDGYAYYTNNPPAGAFRGFGVTQTCFAMETMLNKMATLVGISGWEIRYKNAIRPGQVLPNAQIVDDSTALVETLLAVKPFFDNNKYVGIACAMKNAGVGVGAPDEGRVRLLVNKGLLEVHCGGSCIGQGLGTVLKQVVCSVTGLKGEEVLVIASNTQTAPDSGTTSGSRHTLVSGEAARRAAMAFCERAKGRALADLEGEEFNGYYLAKTDALGSKKDHPISHVAYGYATQVCILNEETKKVEKLVAAHAVGRAINPTNIEGQIEGGLVMGMGYALRERYPIVDCKPTARFGTLGLFKANEIPTIEPIIVEKEGLKVASGAIGIGEITCIPTAPAIADAYRKLDGEFRFALPLTNTPYERK